MARGKQRQGVIRPGEPPALPRGGHATAYRPEYDDQARKLCLLGATNAKLGDFFEVSETTIENWLVAHPSFKEAVHAGKDKADAEIAASLYGRAKGHVQTARKVVVVNNVPEVVEFKEEFPPDVMAASLWLRNRQPDLWKDKVEVGHSGSIGQLSPEEVDERLARLIAKAKKDKEK